LCGALQKPLVELIQRLDDGFRWRGRELTQSALEFSSCFENKKVVIQQRLRLHAPFSLHGLDQPLPLLHHTEEGVSRCCHPCGDMGSDSTLLQLQSLIVTLPDCFGVAWAERCKGLVSR